MIKRIANLTNEVVMKNGYDLPIYGIDNGQFYYLHIPALVCISLSLIAIIIVLILSFRHQKFTTFFRWSKHYRFVVYLAICDGLFNVCHFMDHFHILITRDHVYPKELCAFYGFMLTEFIIAQTLMVNIISINAFSLVFFEKKISFGKYDYRLFLWMFGAPCIGGIIATVLDKMGPNGAFCYFDGVNGEMANLLFITVPLLLILVINATLYILTWIRIRREEPKFKGIKGSKANITQASHRAARTMSLFVAAFVIQWWAMAMHGVWQYANNDVPQTMYHFVTTFSNIGGILNGIVYMIIRKRRDNICVDLDKMKRNAKRKSTITFVIEG